MSSATDLLSGRLAPTGGIRPPRSLRITDSHVCASSAIRSGDSVSRANPPILAVLLWQLRQFCWITVHGPCCGVGACKPTIVTLASATPIVSKARIILGLANIALLISTLKRHLGRPLL